MDKIYLPTNEEIQEIQRDVILKLEESDVILSLMRDRYTDYDMVKWEQEDNAYGAMQVRGLDGKPGVVKKGGVNQFSMEPGYYGEFYQFTERELNRARKVGTHGEVIDIEDQVIRKQQLLIERRLNRKRLVISNLLRLGHFTTVSESGHAIHSDSFNLKIRVPGVEWSDKYDATPLKDLREWKALSDRNTSSRFDKTSQLIANTTSINWILNNRNEDDLGGVRVELGTTLNSLEDINKLLAANDLPQLVEYDATIQTDPENRESFEMVIPDGDFIWVGSRPNGERLGEFLGTKNINAPQGNRDGIYSKVIDTFDREVPRRIEVHHGFNGGPAIYFPTAVQSIRTS